MIGKPLKKLKRVGAQQDEWASLEEKGETPKAWQPKEKGTSKTTNTTEESSSSEEFSSCEESSSSKESSSSEES